MNRSLLLLAIISLLLGGVIEPAVAETPKSCLREDSTQAFREGFEHQQAKRTTQAIQSYERCLELEPGCEACHYEIGWSYWVAERWDLVIYHWFVVLEINPHNDEAKTWLSKARVKAGVASNPVPGLEGLRRVSADFWDFCQDQTKQHAACVSRQMDVWLWELRRLRSSHPPVCRKDHRQSTKQLDCTQDCDEMMDEAEADPDLELHMSDFINCTNSCEDDGVVWEVEDLQECAQLNSSLRNSETC